MAFFFISHSHDDREAAEDLHARLSHWGFTSVFLDVHPRDGLAVGVEWERELYAQMRSAHAVLYLGSPASAGSQWCFAEVTLARFCGRSILPLWLGGSARPELLETHQWLDLSAGEVAYEQLKRTIDNRFGPRAGYSWDGTRGPFPGLRAFQAEDAAVFFGRDQKVSEVLRHLESSAVRGCVVAVVGPSGSGKSSLVRAGVEPRLRRAVGEWLVVPPFTPGEHPMTALARALCAAAESTDRPIDRRELVRTLENDPADLSEYVLDLKAGRGVGRRSVLLVVDKAEELVSLAAPEERQRFLAALGSAVHGSSALQVLTTLRSEVLGTALYETTLADLIQETVLLGPLDRSRLAEVVEAPARIAGFDFAPGLTARMVDDTRGGDALPLLAHTLRRLVEGGATEDGAISHEEYDAVGGVLGALEQTGDTVARRARSEGWHDAILPTLMRMVTLDLGGHPARRPVRRADLDDVQLMVIDAFVQARLLTSDGQVVEIAHEALLRQWPPLSFEIEASQDRLRLRADLERLADDWHRSKQEPSYLLREGRLTRFNRWAGEEARRLGLTPTAFLDSAAPEHLSATGRDFLAASNRQQDSERRRRRRGRHRMVVLGVGIITLAFTLFLVARQNILSALDANLLQRATAAAHSDLVDPEQLATLPPESTGAGDVRIALLYDNGLAQSARGVETSPPLGAEELEVARGEHPTSVRSAGDGGQTYRVVAVGAGPGRALVIGQSLDSTRRTFVALALPLSTGGLLGAVIAATNIVGLLAERRRAERS